jgi:hypothetical protein
MADDIKDRAEAQFKKEERSSDAMAEYKAAREAERAKTERLRALRLAKEAAGKKKSAPPVSQADDWPAGARRLRSC